MQELKEYIKPGVTAFLVGIGGVSMCALADMLKKRGVLVRGSDIRESENVRRLRKDGIEVVIGHAAENIEGASMVIRTAAAHDDNPEVSAARSAGIPVFERAEAWGAIMEDFSQALLHLGHARQDNDDIDGVQIALGSGT